ncbi:hypothetical protein [Agrobacterium tumefaciens]|uniref:hypothetical protein n=1 Tax=Agrobacterium tumefaciens TaxID=358 RepID=UPI003BA1002F
MKWKSRNVRAMAEIICGNGDYGTIFKYRSSSHLTFFFEDCDLEFIHDGSTRWAWVSDRLLEVFDDPPAGANLPPAGFIRIVRTLLNKRDAMPGDTDRSQALASLNAVITDEGWEAFYDDHGVAQLRNIQTSTISDIASPHRPMTKAEVERRNELTAYLGHCSEDDLIEQVLVPLFKHLGFQRVTVAGHKDKALEYGKDVWMKFTLPTLHVLYFGIQAKKGKVDSAGVSKSGSANVAEILNQAMMMLGHEIFDPETNRRSLVDHAFIIAGGEITKQARNWLGGKLDAAKRSQIIFMDRDDIVNLFVVNNIALPKAAIYLDEDIQF